MRRPRFALAFALFGATAVVASVASFSPTWSGKAAVAVDNPASSAITPSGGIPTSKGIMKTPAQADPGFATQMTNDPARQTPVMRAAPRTPPVTYDCTRSFFPPNHINANEDNYVWQEIRFISAGQSFRAYLDTEHEGGTDDYLCTDALNLEGGKTYRCVLKIQGGRQYQDLFEFCYGDSLAPERLDKVMIPPTTLDGDTIHTFVGFVKPEKSGQYYVGVHVITPGKGSDISVYYMSIGAGVGNEGPNIVQDLSIDASGSPYNKAVINFTAPTHSLGGDNLAGPLKMNIYRDNEPVAQLATKAGEKVTWIDYPPQTVNTATYSFEAIDPETGNGMMEDMEVGFGDEDGLVFTPLADPVAPPCKWEFVKYSYFGMDNFPYETTNPADYYFAWNNVLDWGLCLDNGAGPIDHDTWVYTPGLKLKAGTTYQVTFTSYNTVEGAVSTVDLGWGEEQNHEAITNWIVKDYELIGTQSEPVLWGGEITVDKDGIYYVGLYNHTPADAPNIEGNAQCNSVLEISIPGIGGPTPAACEVVTTPDPDGFLAVSATVTTPTLTVEGSEIEGDLIVDFTRDNAVVKRIENVAPGTVLTFDDPVVEWGNHTYNAYAVSGNGRGADSNCGPVFVGTPVPNVPNHFTMVSHEGDNVSLQWDAVTMGEGGVKIPEAQTVKYTVVDASANVLAADLTATSYDGLAVEPGTQMWNSFGVYASTNGGNSQTSVMTPWTVFGATPYELPFTESFADGNSDKTWLSKAPDPQQAGVAFFATGDRYWDIEVQDGDNGMACLNGAAGMLSGRIHISQPTLLSMWVQVFASSGFDANELQVLVYPDCDITQAPDTVKTVQVGDLGTPSDGYAEWFPMYANLGKYTGKTVILEFRQPSYYYYNTFIDNISTLPLLDENLAVSKLTVPAKATAGRDANVNVKVENLGANASGDYTVELWLNGNKIDEKADSGLEPSEARAYAFVVPVTTGMVSGDFEARVEYAADQDAADNVATASIGAISYSTLPAPEIQGNRADGANELTWTVPDYEGCPITESFEDAEPWTSEVEGWTIIDNDHNPFGGFSDVALPGYENYVSMASWMVFDWDFFTGASSALMAYTGSKYLGSMYANDGTTDLASDEWLISPRLNGQAQRIEFCARQFTPRFKYEQIQFMTSTGGNSIEDFVNYFDDQDARIVIKNQWQRMYADIDEGTNYFAIRCVSDSAFVMMLDDITYIPEENLKLTGFNLYRNGQLIAQLPATATSYVDNVFDTPRQQYVLAAVYDRGESAPSNLVELDNTVVGIESILGAAQRKVYNLQGVYLGNSMDELPSGIYIVKTGKKVVKVRK